MVCLSTVVNPCRASFFGVDMQSVETTIRVSALEDEISRLRLIIGGLRAGLLDDLAQYGPINVEEWQVETDKLMYGEQL